MNDEVLLKKDFEQQREDSGSLIMIQVTVCVIILVMAVALKFIDRETFQNFKSWYNLKLNDTVKIGAIRTDCDNFIKSLLSEVGEENANSINQTSGATAPNINLSVQMRCPVDDAIVTSEFGPREDPKSGTKKNHAGLDIGAEKNTEVHSALSGIVKKSEENESYGKYVVVDHGNGIETLYAHCEKSLVSSGDKVLRGQPVALVGNTGDSTGDHLHFEVIVNGINYNPKPLILA